MLIVLVPILMNKDIFELSYNGLKFMVQNHNYFWINLIIYIGAHWSLILCKFHSVLWFFYYLKYKPICRGNGISFSRNFPSPSWMPRVHWEVLSGCGVFARGAKNHSNGMDSIQHRHEDAGSWELCSPPQQKISFPGVTLEIQHLQVFDA